MGWMQVVDLQQTSFEQFESFWLHLNIAILIWSLSNNKYIVNPLTASSSHACGLLFSIQMPRIITIITNQFSFRRTNLCKH